MTKKRPDYCGSYAQTRRVDLAELEVGADRVFADFPDCCCGAACRRIMLSQSTPQPIDVVNDSISKIIARVTTGDACGGGIEFEVDWKTGVALDLIGCRTQVAYRLIEKLGTTGHDVRSLTALLACCGAGAARGLATRTYPRMTIAAGGIGTVVVPPFAYAVLFASTAPTALYVATTSFAQLDQGDIETVAGDVFSSLGYRRTGWPLYGGVQNVGILNGALTSIDVEPVFLIGV